MSADERRSGCSTPVRRRHRSNAVERSRHFSRHRLRLGAFYAVRCQAPSFAVVFLLLLDIRAHFSEAEENSYPDPGIKRGSYFAYPLAHFRDLLNALEPLAGA